MTLTEIINFLIIRFEKYGHAKARTEMRMWGVK